VLNEWSDRVADKGKPRPFLLSKEFFLDVLSTLIGLALLASLASWFL
jgi:hypothetical protein